MKDSIFTINFIFCITFLAFYACNTKPEVEDSLNNRSIVKKVDPVVKRTAKTYRTQVVYELDTMHSVKEVDSLFALLNEDQKKVLLDLNRIEQNRIKPKMAIIVPECISHELVEYSPMPQHVHVMKCLPKSLIINQRIQAFGLYENGDLIRWGPISSGKKSTPTPNGLYYTNYKSKMKTSSVNHAWKLPYYFNIMNNEGIGMHQYEMPGHPASHGCIRLKMEDAQFIYDWADTWGLENNQVARHGTPVMLIGEYDYQSEIPWHLLKENMKADDFTKEEFLTLEKYMLAYQEDTLNDKNLEEIQLNLHK
ncbi:L,D-transpeptidase [Gramella lutea]|uniref:L,D-transpeptidase n=1 Tax=Christiangramia lutea TaxID=1607951 RepID=A0A9X1V3N7_9FLAO|nr:L,D-transpeptidase [Christiangramia lutea]MCH4823635.1 L,D-transpeptidase [Christiangramia lutea]